MLTSRNGQCRSLPRVYAVEIAKEAPEGPAPNCDWRLACNKQIEPDCCQGAQHDQGAGVERHAHHRSEQHEEEVINPEVRLQGSQQARGTRCMALVT